MDRIASFCDDAGLPWDDERAWYMTNYLELLMQFNEAMNLIGPLDRSAVVDELLIDSLVAAVARAPKGPILDVGTGAGLPGIPLKIVFPDAPLTLVEPRLKRSTFLKIATHRLDLDDVTLFRGRIEAFEEIEEREIFDVVISKAFQAPVKWLVTASEFIADDGSVVCMARRHDGEELAAVAASLKLEKIGESTVGSAGPEQRVCYAFGRS